MAESDTLWGTKRQKKTTRINVNLIEIEGNTQYSRALRRVIYRPEKRKESKAGLEYVYQFIPSFRYKSGDLLPTEGRYPLYRWFI